MLGVYVTVPVACFRKGLAREYLETEPLPPPATCYGFLLSLVGETRRMRHAGCRIVPVLVGRPSQSVVLRTVWRCKDKNYWVDPTGRHHIVPNSKKERDAFKEWTRSQGWPDPDFRVGLGSGTNARPDFQQLLSDVRLVVWVDSTEEPIGTARLEDRVHIALTTPAAVTRFGGLSLGESTHLVNDVSLFVGDAADNGEAYLLAKRGRISLPVWVDHVGSAGTRYVTGDLELGPLTPPPRERMPRIHPDGDADASADQSASGP